MSNSFSSSQSEKHISLYMLHKLVLAFGTIPTKIFNTYRIFLANKAFRANHYITFNSNLSHILALSYHGYEQTFFNSYYFIQICYSISIFVLSKDKVSNFKIIK